MHQLSELNDMPSEEFVRVVGPVFEHSTWVSERVVSERPFPNVSALHVAMCEKVKAASADEQLSLIRAHPDLVGNAVLTAESQDEQARAGLMNLSAEEVELFGRYNREYKSRFGFPFVICARLNKKDAILSAFPPRLENSPEQEIQTALSEIFKIAELRLADLIQ
jgi:2-oxo-4-hydroxy-4-carboxy-5-ureidoimidazoline decarboxylase